MELMLPEWSVPYNGILAAVVAGTFRPARKLYSRTQFAVQVGFNLSRSVHPPPLCIIRKHAQDCMIMLENGKSLDHSNLQLQEVILKPVQGESIASMMNLNCLMSSSRSWLTARIIIKVSELIWHGIGKKGKGCWIGFVLPLEALDFLCSWHKLFYPSYALIKDRFLFC